MSIKVRNLTVTYNQRPAVHQLSVIIQSGSLLAVVGPNGAGKSTLLHALAGLIRSSAGVIEGLSQNDVAYLPQQSELDKSFPLTTENLVATGLWQRSGFGSSISVKQWGKITAAIAAVGLAGLQQRMINTLSGGQLQRALFARILVQDQPIILLDEPFNAIDTKTVADLTLVIKKWHHDKKTVVLVTHDLEYVRRHCPQTLLLARHCIRFGDTDQVLTTENLQHAKRVCEMFDEYTSQCEQNAA